METKKTTEEDGEKIRRLEEENKRLKEEILDLREKIASYEWAMGI